MDSKPSPSNKSEPETDKSKEMPREMPGVVGYKFQAELILYLCLKLHLMQFDFTKIAFNIKEYPKFRHIYCEFEYDGETYVLLFQVRHIKMGNNKNHITKKLLIGPNKAVGLRHYLGNIAKISQNPKLEGKNVFFIFLTTTSIDPEISECVNLNDYKSLEEFNKIFQDILQPEKVGVIKKLKQKEMKSDIHGMLKNKQDDDSKVLPELNNLKDLAKYICQNLLYITDLVKNDDLEEINNELMGKIFQKSHNQNECDKELYARTLRTNLLLHFKEFQSEGGLNKVDLKNLISNALSKRIREIKEKDNLAISSKITSTTRGEKIEESLENIDDILKSGHLVEIKELHSNVMEKKVKSEEDFLQIISQKLLELSKDKDWNETQMIYWYIERIYWSSSGNYKKCFEDFDKLHKNFIEVDKVCLKKKLSYEQFLETLCELISKEDEKFSQRYRTYEYLTDTNIDTLTWEKSIEIFGKKSYNFIRFMGDSIFFSFWVHGKVLLIFKCIKILSAEVLEDIAENFCKNKSLKEWEESEDYYKEWEINYLSEIFYTWYLCKIHRKEELLQHLCKYDNRRSIFEIIKRGLIICTAVDIFEAENSKLLRTLVKKFCNKKTNIHFLHGIANTTFSDITIFPRASKRMKWDNELINLNSVFPGYRKNFQNVLNCIFEHLKNNELLLRLLEEKDSDGNVALQICALKLNADFLDSCFKYLPEDSLKMMNHTNNKEQNFFHCIDTSTEDENSFTDFIVHLADNLNDLLNDDKFLKINFLQKDKNGKTPFHRTDSGLMLYQLRVFMSHETIKNLLKIKDNSNKTILNYMNEYPGDPYYHIHSIELFLYNYDWSETLMERLEESKECLLKKIQEDTAF